MPNTPNTSKSNAPKASGPKPTSAQLNYLRTLAAQTATSFAYPATKVQASREIGRLKALAGRTDRRLAVGDARRDRRHISRDLAERSHDAIAIRDDEVAGFGSSAHWA
jgi:hypothetical protein